MIERNRKNSRGKAGIIILLLLVLAYVSLLSETRADASGSTQETANLNLSKTAVYNTTTNAIDYQLEAYTTGVVETVVKDKPTDIVLVLDQSGSMGSTDFTTYTKFSSPSTNSALYANASNLYVSYQNGLYKVTVTSGSGSASNRLFTYSFTVNGTTITQTSNGTTTQPFGDSAHPLFWENLRLAAKVSRAQGLINTVESFVNQVYTKANGATNGTGQDVDHRISIVGFACDASQTCKNNDPNRAEYQNTNILSSPTNTTTKYSPTSSIDSALSASMLSVLSSKSNLDNAATRIGQSGGTFVNFGFDMAKRIMSLTSNGFANKDRAKIVIMLTDGEPGINSSSFDTDVANQSIASAKYLKDNGVKVYSVGIIDNADPSNVTTNLNKFMNYVSSNYPSATSMSTSGSGSNAGYYVKATDSASMASLFTKVSEEISAPATTVLDEAAVVLDVVEQQFQVPLRENVRMYTSTYLGNNSWGNLVACTACQATVDAQAGTVSVNGFKYSDEYIATVNGVPRGRKLVIQFSAAVSPDFMGGNTISTNGADSGLYVPGNDVPVSHFPQPTVDIPITAQITVQDSSQYLSQSTVLENLLKNAGKDYQIKGTNYTVNGKNNAYTDIIYTLRNSQDDIVGVYTVPAGSASGSWTTLPYADPLDSTSIYTITTTFSPHTGGSSQAVQRQNQAVMHVFYPEITTTDETIYLGETTQPLMERKSLVRWRSESSSAPVPAGDAPVLTYGLVSESGNDPRGAAFFAPTQDSRLKLQVIGNGQDITANALINQSKGGNPQGDITIYVRTLSLTVSKTFTDDVSRQAIQSNEYGQQSFIFHVTNTANPAYTYTIILEGDLETLEKGMTLTGLPIGTYTVVEDSAWSWRYSSDMIQQSTSLSRTKIKDTLVFRNTLKDTEGLSKDALIRNIFQKGDQ